MEGLFYIWGIILLVVMYPYIRCFRKRWKCFRKVKRFCKKQKYKLHATHKFWFLGRKCDKACDFYIETDKDVYAVKLFSMLHRTSMLIFREDGTYLIRRFMGVLWIRFFWNSKLIPLVGYDFRHRFKDEWRLKTPHNILLINPISMDIFRQYINGYEDAVGVGDELYGMKIFSLSRFLEYADR